MKIPFFIIAAVLLSSAFKHKLAISGFVVLNKNETKSPSNLTHPVLVYSSVHGSNESAAIGPTVVKPAHVIHPVMLSVKSPVDDKANESTSPVSTGDNPLKQPLVLPVIAPVVVSAPIENTSNPCAHKVCPLIACRNMLPELPSQGICCPRCVTNPNCNTSACPVLKCATHIVPANLSAGECCDHCGPIVDPVPTKSTAKPEKTTEKSEKTTEKPEKPESSSERQEEEEQEEESSSSEQSREECFECPMHDFYPKPYIEHLIRVLTEAVDHFCDFHSHRQHYHSNESEDN